MTKIYAYLLSFSLLFLAFGCGKKEAVSAQPQKIPQRIISFAPNITETLCALGLGNKIVGNTPYCTSFNSTNKCAKIGSFGHFNFEAIVSLHPDLVILHHENTKEIHYLKQLHIPTLPTGSFTIADILETIQKIGTACGVEKKANALISKLKTDIESHRKHPANPPRVLLLFGSNHPKKLYAFGRKSLQHELLEIVGGQNVIQQNRPFVELSTEALIRLNPDLIILLVPNAPPLPQQEWNKLSALSAVQHHRIVQLTGNYTCIPSPRFIQTLNDFSRLINEQITLKNPDHL